MEGNIITVATTGMENKMENSAGTWSTIAVISAGIWNVRDLSDKIYG